MANTYRRYRRERDMRGPYEFTPEVIYGIPDDLYGVYLLVHESEDGVRIVTYVGRGIIKERLTEHLDEKEALGFYFKDLEDDFEGFEEECRLFHLYGKRRHLDNKNHPPVPAGAPRNYPKCSELGCNGEAG